jgi:hypothetical protein
MAMSADEGARGHPTRRKATLIVVGVTAALALAAGALLTAGRGNGESGSAATTAAPAPGCDDPQPRPVPQPTPAQMRAAGLDKLPLAPERDRVDLVAPPFSDPTHVANPLFPISRLHSAILNGRVDGKTFRVETTLLPQTRFLEWTDGQCVETLVSQYVAYLDGRIHETALDHYAQADDGSVWYLGEDVFNYDDGIIADVAGTWHAGKEGPAAMIMPGDPQVGVAYRPENIAGLVFEEVTVKETGKEVDGPRGRVPGAIVVQEIHADGNREEKIFAPGYGEFFTGAGGEVEALALAVPTDALPGPAPAELRTLSAGSDDVFEAAQRRQWDRAAAIAKQLSAAWSSHEPKAPPRLRPPMSHAIDALVKAVGARDRAAASQAAVDAAQASRDLALQYRPVASIDVDRFDVWLRQALVDAQARDLGGVTGDHVTLEWIRDRIAGSLGKVDVTRIDTNLGELRTNLDEKDFQGAIDTANALRRIVGRIRGS